MLIVARYERMRTDVRWDNRGEDGILHFCYTAQEDHNNILSLLKRTLNLLCLLAEKLKLRT